MISRSLTTFFVAVAATLSVHLARADAVPATPPSQKESAPTAAENAYLLLRWSDNGQLWIKEVRSMNLKLVADGVIPSTALYKNQQSGHDCQFQPVFDVYRSGDELRVKAQLLQSQDTDTTQSIVWDGTLKRGLSGPIHLGMAGRSVVLEIQRIEPNAAGEVDLALK